MRRPLMALLVAASVAPAWPAVLASDGEPPVTIIEIPTPTTTFAESSTIPASPGTPASTPGVEQESPPSTRITEPTISEVDPVLNLEGSAWPWQAIAGLALALGGLTYLSLVLVRRAFVGRGWGRTPRSKAPEPNPVSAAIAASSRGFEAVEYRTGSALDGSAVRARTIGQFSSLEDAIEAARVARSEYNPQVPDPDAWWVVWNLGSRRASWIAEWDTPGESVIDLRSGRREPYVAQEARDPHREDA